MRHSTILLFLSLLLCYQCNAQDISTVADMAEVRSERLAEKQKLRAIKSQQRASSNYGLSPTNSPALHSPRKRRSFMDIHKPTYWPQPTLPPVSRVTEAIKHPMQELKRDVRHVRRMRGLAGLRDAKTRKLDESVFWVFTGVWIVMGGVFITVVTLI
ncbi:hypothetical protein HDU98_009080 [Podochytrium sp. JEL0797]|nr:hypothetical protein HDU98_009080 [Podochytrium sp. JEL0797]